MGFGAAFYENHLFAGEKTGRAKAFGPFLIHQAGALSCADGYEVPPHRQWCHELSIVISGRGAFSADGATAVLSEGAVQFVPKGCIHALSTAENADLRYAYVGFSFSPEAGSHSLAPLFSFFDRTGPFCLSGKETFLLPLFLRLEEFSNQEPYADAMIEYGLIQLLILLYRAKTGQKTPSHDREFSRNHFQRPVYGAIKYIDRHILEKISVSELAAALGYSSGYLSTRFKACTGQTVRQFITRRKMQKAVELMRFAKLTPSETARTLSYSDVQAFNKAFRRCFSCPPTAFETLPPDARKTTPKKEQPL